MALLVLGLLLFLGFHSLPMIGTVRQRLVERFGLKAYKGLFSLLSLAGFVLIIFGKARAPFVPLWDAPEWGRHAAMGIMPFAFILLMGAYIPSNIKRFTRHPMLWGVTLWAAAHLLANGDLASVLLFGGFGIYSLADMASENRRGAQLQAQRLSPLRDGILVVAGLAMYGIFLFAHPFLFGPALV